MPSAAPTGGFFPFLELIPPPPHFAKIFVGLGRGLLGAVFKDLTPPWGLGRGAERGPRTQPCRRGGRQRGAADRTRRARGRKRRAGRGHSCAGRGPGWPGAGQTAGAWAGQPGARGGRSGLPAHTGRVTAAARRRENGAAGDAWGGRGPQRGRLAGRGGAGPRARGTARDRRARRHARGGPAAGENNAIQQPGLCRVPGFSRVRAPVTRVVVAFFQPAAFCRNR